MNERSHGPVLAAGLVATAAFVAVALASVRAEAPVTQTRAVAPFERVALDGAFTATIVAGAATHVAMTGAAEDLARVTVAVAHGRLVVTMGSGNVRGKSIVLAIATPALRSFENDGAGLVHLRGLRGDVDLENRGTAMLDATGTATRLTVVNDGVGKIDARAVDARDATVTNNGVGSIVLRASGALVMHVNGIGDIRYAGDPAHVESRVDGLGRIGRL